MAKSLSDTFGMSLISTPIEMVMGWTGGNSNWKVEMCWSALSIQFTYKVKLPTVYSTAKLQMLKIIKSVQQNAPLYF